MKPPEITVYDPTAKDSIREHDHGFLLYREIHKLAEAEQRGDLAELRRMDPDRPETAAFFRILAHIAPTAGNETIRRYAHYLRILAQKPGSLSSDRLGEVMARAGISESRVQRLLSARGNAVSRQALFIARRLASYGNIPWRGFALILLSKEERADDVRLFIARDYWRTLDKSVADNSRLED